MYTVSGIDPQAVKNLVSNVEALRKQMQEQLSRVNGEIAQSVRQHYQGNAADTLLANINREVPKLIDFMQNLVKVLVNNINDDLSDTQNTDNALAG